MIANQGQRALHLPVREKDYTPPVLNLVFHVKLWMKHAFGAKNNLLKEIKPILRALIAW